MIQPSARIEREIPAREATTATGLADFIEWDVRNWSGAVDFWLSHTSQDVAQCSALEIGSRNGGLSLWLASQGARVLCSDIHMPGDATIARHRKHRVSHLIDYQAIDAMNIPYADHFDIVVFKSVLGIVGNPPTRENQARAIAQMHKALKKGGELFFAENLSASFLHRFFRERFVEWAHRWRYVTIAEMQRHLSCFSKVEFRALGFAGAFGRNESQRNILGVLDRQLLNHVLPRNWKYIITGVAVK